MSRTELVTILAETEAVVNSRPLVYVDNDINSGEPLTPGHFLSPNRKTGVPLIKEIPYDSGEASIKLVNIWKGHQKNLENFWKIWLSQYLQAVRERSSLGMKPIKGENVRKPRVGEIVIVREINQPRGRWKLGKIDSLIESDVDNQHRAAKVLLHSGELIKRPFRLIYPLESNIGIEP